MSHSAGQYSFFDIENQMSKIHQLSNFLCRLNEAVNWEMFRVLSIAFAVRMPRRKVVARLLMLF
jgi:hypothetical protein